MTAIRTNQYQTPTAFLRALGVNPPTSLTIRDSGQYQVTVPLPGSYASFDHLGS